MFYFAASTQTGSGNNTQEPFSLQEEEGLYYTDVNKDAGIVNPAPYYNTGQEIYVLKLSPEGVPVWGSFVGGQDVHVQPDYYQGGGDVLCALQVRNDRLYIGGCTNSIHFLPLHWILPAFGSAVAPSIQDPDSPDQWNGFIADLSYLYNLDVSTGPQAANAAGFAVFPSPAEGMLSVGLPVGTGPLDLVIHDATGREVLRERTAPPTGAVAHVDISTLARGAYVLSLRGGCMLGARFIKH